MIWKVINCSLSVWLLLGCSAIFSTDGFAETLHVYNGTTNTVWVDPGGGHLEVGPYVSMSIFNDTSVDFGIGVTTNGTMASRNGGDSVLTYTANSTWVTEVLSGAQTYYFWQGFFLIMMFALITFAGRMVKRTIGSNVIED